MPAGPHTKFYSQPISIIVIAYNEEKYIAKTLASLSRQTVTDFEVIVVDSNSTDGTEAAARAFAGVLPGFRYVQLTEALGPAYGRNRGAEVARHNRLLFLDADTVLSPGFIEKSSAELEANRVDLATSPLRVIEPSLLSNVGAVFLNSAMRILRPIYASGYGACLFSTRQVHEACNGFDENIGICEDCHYIKKARDFGFRFRILHSIFHTSDRRAHHEGNLRVMVKYMKCHLWRLLTRREICRKKITYVYGQY